jgi:hypothetical protein
MQQGIWGSSQLDPTYPQLCSPAFHFVKSFSPKKPIAPKNQGKSEYA